MKKLFAFVLLFGTVLLVPVAAGWEHSSNTAHETVRVFLLSELRDCIRSVNAVMLPGANRVECYREARKHYKRIEFFVEHYSKREAKYFINGPLVPKHDPDQGNVEFAPQGFQRLEELLFSEEAADTTVLNEECRKLTGELTKLERYYTDVEITDSDLLEMCQLQLFRISAMTLNGYDATISLDGIKGAAWNTEGLQEVVRAFSTTAAGNENTNKIHKALVRQLARAKKNLLANTDYNSFNRLRFITEHVNRINASLVAFHNACGLSWNSQKQALNLREPFLFGSESLDMRFFSIYYDDTLNRNLQAELGRQLFFDPQLSSNGEKACAGCHQPDRMFTDGLARGTGIDGQTLLTRNTPTLAYVAFQQSFFYDGRAYQLEQQVHDVVHNVSEMDGNLEQTVERLRRNETYRSLFSAAFDGTPDSGITVYAVLKCISEYEKTIAQFSSRFDRYVRGDRSALNKREVNGYNLFAGKALCASCHFFPLFNGTVPPYFSDSEFEVIGTAADSTNRVLDEDPGRYVVTRMEMHRRAFKTPTVRNVQYTSPYMHNGAYGTLEQVVEFYHKGGGAGFGLDVPNQTLPFDSLVLSSREKEDIVLFLKALSDVDLQGFKKP